MRETESKERERERERERGGERERRRVKREREKRRIKRERESKNYGCWRSNISADSNSVRCEDLFFNYRVNNSG